ncbi:MAG: 4Fe-4S binding protein [Chloroflexi bacterium]|nr:4Fe-4S binding protein [Chloroflexota bacterium]MCL5109740.1 4Fe-4S binding protein [Chloroflexota bacterium]
MVYVEVRKCTGCGVCVATCPKQAISLADGLASVDSGACDQCGRCLEVCPVGAICGVGEVLPVRLAGVQPHASAQPATLAAKPALVSQVLSRVAPVALDVVVALVDRWLARRSEAAGGAVSLVSESPGVLPPSLGRRMRRRRGRG